MAGVVAGLQSASDGAGMPGCDAVAAGRLRDPEIARSEYSASTSDRVQTGAWITTEGPIAPDRPSHELTHSRRGGGRAASRSAISRPAEPASQTGMTVPLANRAG